MTTRGCGWPIAVRRRLSRIALGVILSCYGLHRILQIPRLLRSPWYLSPPSVVRVVKWWPTPPSWLSACSDHGLMYLGWLCLAVFAVGGIGIVLGHRMTMRIVLVALGIWVGLWATQLPFDIALACGWITFDYSHVNAAAVQVSPEILRHPPAGLMRLGAFFALLFAFLWTLLLIAAFVWLRREIGRDVATSGSVADAQQAQAR